MPGIVDEEWINVGEEISLINSLFGLTDFLLDAAGDDVHNEVVVKGLENGGGEGGGRHVALPQ